MNAATPLRRRPVIHSGITVSTDWIPVGSILRNTANYEIMTPEGESSCVTRLTVSI